MKIKTKIPVSREILVDMETPLSVYRKLANGPYSYLFESVEGGENWARYSLIGLEASQIIFIKKNQIEIELNGKIIESFHCDDPLEYIDKLHKSFDLKKNNDLPIFNGGLVGYFGYDCVRYIESKLVDSEPPDTIGTPDALFMISDEVAVFDNLKNKLHLIVLIESEDDGIEIFGGSVNMSNITVSNAHDDYFDTDHGHSGTIDGLKLYQSSRYKGKSLIECGNTKGTTTTTFKNVTFNDFDVSGYVNNSDDKNFNIKTGSMITINGKILNQSTNILP